MLKDQILQTIKKYNLIEKEDKVVVGVSGGPDSICLLHILNSLKSEMNFEISVAHINHMIREEADMETEYVREFCKKINIPCFIKKADVINIAENQKKGTEETGREIRYDFFEEVLKKTNSNKIATAHNNNDKIETIIMNMLRGSGTSGLKGIEAKRDNKFIRPLIETTRDEIENYCNENNLQPKYDKSNNENTYTRNKIRNIVIPYIKKEFNPNIIKTMDRLSTIITEENEYLNEITKKTFKEIYININMQEEIPTSYVPLLTSITLDLKKFNILDNVIKRRLILYTINKLMGSIQGIEKTNIEDIMKMCSNNIGNKYLSPIKGLKILVKKQKIFFTWQPELP